MLDQLRADVHLAIQPLTTLIEVAAAIRRRTGSAALASRVHRDLQQLSAFQFIELDAHRADEAADLAVLLGLRGMDAVVVQVCREFGSSLVSLDDEMVARASSHISVRPAISF